MAAVPGPDLERPAIGDAASRGWGTHLAVLPSVTTQHQGGSLRRLAMHAPQPRSLIHAPIAGRSYPSKPADWAEYAAALRAKRREPGRMAASPTSWSGRCYRTGLPGRDGPAAEVQR